MLAGIAFLALIGAMLAYRAQSEQLRLQRIQLENQTRVQEREQANQVDVISPTNSLLVGSADVRVTNSSNRPVREVTAKIVAVASDGSVLHE